MKVVVSLGYLLVVLGAREPVTLKAHAWSELPLFVLLASVGMMMMVSATELLTLYIAMELAAYPVYIAIALHRNPAIGGESSTKYMVQGMMASAVSLYGMSFLYGLAGSTYFEAITGQMGALTECVDAVAGSSVVTVHRDRAQPSREIWVKPEDA